MIIIETEPSGITKLTLKGKPLEALRLARRLTPWLEALDAATFCVTPSQEQGRDRRRGERPTQSSALRPEAGRPDGGERR